MKYNWVKYIGDTIYHSYKDGWYNKVSETILTEGKTYRLLKTYEVVEYLPKDIVYLSIEDDVLLNMTSIQKNEHHNYDGTMLVNTRLFQFITNREMNLEILT